VRQRIFASAQRLPGQQGLGERTCALALQFTLLRERFARRTQFTASGGKQQLLRITISKDVVDPNDVESLQDLVTVAINQALESSQSIVEAEVGKLTGGLNLGGLFG
jgi:hypothetical protein